MYINYKKLFQPNQTGFHDGKRHAVHGGGRPFFNFSLRRPGKEKRGPEI